MRNIRAKYGNGRELAHNGRILVAQMLASQSTARDDAHCTEEAALTPVPSVTWCESERQLTSQQRWAQKRKEEV